jgi:hypothetical protein
LNLCSSTHGATLEEKMNIFANSSLAESVESFGKSTCNSYAACRTAVVQMFVCLFGDLMFVKSKQRDVNFVVCLLGFYMFWFFPFCKSIFAIIEKCKYLVMHSFCYN